jgi:hypothetical protein
MSPAPSRIFSFAINYRIRINPPLPGNTPRHPFHSRSFPPR